MQILVSMEPVKRDNRTRAVGFIKFGEITVDFVSLVEVYKGCFILNMPSKVTECDNDKGRLIFENIAFPLTRDLREILTNAAVESLNKGQPTVLTDRQPGRLMVEAVGFKEPYMNRVGKGWLTICDYFVIHDFFINRKPDGSLYVTFPFIKTSARLSNGRSVYKQILWMERGFRQQVSNALIEEYKKDMLFRKADHLSIKSRIDEGLKRSKISDSNIKTAGRDEVIL